MDTRQTGFGSLTPEQVEHYNREGYIVLRGLLDPSELAPVRESLNKKVSEIALRLKEMGLIEDLKEHEPFEHRLAELFRNLDGKTFNTFGRSWRDREPGFFDLMSNPKILDAVESLIGPELFSNPVYNIRPKVPKVAAGAVPWHQDKSYWPDANSNPVITVWIPLVDADEENGCLRLVPHTHTSNVVSFHKETRTGTSYTELDPEELEEAIYEHGVLILPVKAGSAILFNDRLMHMSTLNLSDNRVRWSVDLRYQPTDQDPMPQHGVGFLARSRKHPERVATLEDWLAERPEHEPAGALP